MVVVTRSSHKHAAASMIEKLPPDVMVSVLQFVKLPERVRLASCSTLLRKLVYKDCTVLWVDIDFGTVADRMRLRLTDEELASLLTRVNAMHVIKSLNLQSCDKVRGTGLEPLRHSRVLKEVHLCSVFDHSNEGIADAIAVRILRTMIPYNLFQVHFHSREPPSIRMKFLRDLRAARLQQVLEQKITCSSCGDAVVDESRQVVTNDTGVPSHKCAECKNHFCRRGSCSVGLKDCCVCLGACCDDCDSTTRCGVCTNDFCIDCEYLSSCHACNKKVCLDCHGVDECGWCLRSLCENCNEQQDNAIDFCFGCEEGYCHNCRKVADCFTCEQALCEECAEIEVCDSCFGSFCKGCREVNYLACRNEMTCTGCVIPHRCDGCLLNFCGDRVETCGTCEKAFCDLCKELEHCGGCQKSFCNDDCAFVDLCEKCETRYCDGCALVLRCTWCGKASCEKCRLGCGGFCQMCNEKPSKKAKRSSS